MARPSYQQLDDENRQLRQRVAQLEARIHQLEQLLTQATRSARRQAAPFSKGPPKAEPKKPGRKPGDDYGAKACRPAPTPQQIDEVHQAPLPPGCPACGGALQLTRVADQYQTDIPRRPIHRHFRIQIGRCGRCRRRVQGRHPLQTSDALGAAASQIGPNAQAAIAYLNKHAGLSHGKVVDVLGVLHGLDLSRGGGCQSMLRTARRCEPTCQALRQQLNGSPWVVPDETGWRIGGHSAWLHAMVAPRVTLYHIDPGRGYEASLKLLDSTYTGRLIHDGWRSYERYRHATHQTCLAHLLRRSRELLASATRGAVVFPRRVKAILTESLACRDRFAADDISAADAARRADQLQAQLVKLAEPVKTHAGNERFAAHLWSQQHHLFTFLRDAEAGIDATNWRAEQAIRPAVVNRKVWGGNRTEAGAVAQSMLMSVLATCRQQHRCCIDWLSLHLRGQPQPALA